MDRYNFKIVEEKWQKLWEEKKIFSTKVDKTKKKFYCLEMFPYPSGKIHMGHVRNYTIGDVLARFKALQGYNVLHPMGWDSFGMPAENAARQNNLDPKTWTELNIKTMRSQLKKLGLSIDWDKEISTCSEDYYRHQQEFFLELYDKGLVYRKENYVNWDPVDETVLANEQVVDGKGWRSGAIVERKKLNQWFFNISKFSEDLLQGLDALENWPNKVKVMQKNWIGKSFGCEVEFKIESEKPIESIKCYTTRPDTLFGFSFLALSVDHPLAKYYEEDKEFQKFREECSKTGTTEESIASAEKLGFKTDMIAVNPLDKNMKVPVYFANFVLMDYGLGAVFGCPAHDQRDLDFAKKYNLKITPVVKPEKDKDFEINNEAYTGEGYLYNSNFLDGLKVPSESIIKTIEFLEKNNLGKKKTNYRLKDWGISRQRYWGCPIPIAYDENDQPIKIPKEMLPKVLDCAADFGIADASHLGADVPILGVAGDQQAATIGQACFEPGMMKSTYGTGCFALLNTGGDAVPSKNKMLTTIAYQLDGVPTYALEGSIFIAGAVVQWLRDGAQMISHAHETQELAEQGSGDVTIVPAFTGLGAPYWNADCRGAVYGLTRDSGPADFARAALECIGFQTRDLSEAMLADWPNADQSTLRVDGGLSANDWAMQFLSDMLGAAVDRPAGVETTALGAAWLAGMRAGVYPDAKGFAELWACEKQFIPALSEDERSNLYAHWKRCVSATMMV